MRVTGIHVHLRSQELNTELLARYYENVLELARRVQKVTDVSLDYVNMGAGMGIPYAVKDRALNLKSWANLSRPQLPGSVRNFPA